MISTLVAFLSLSSLFFFHPGSVSAHDHHAEARTLPSSWYHEADHKVHDLFRRAPAADGVEYAPVGTPEWKSSFPTPGLPLDVKDLPLEWVAALDVAIAAGKIPDIPVTVALLDGVPNRDGNPTYPPGVDSDSPGVCSSYTRRCKSPGDIWDAPDGMFLSSFDDGPEPATVILMDFLKSQNQKTTHFMIGTNIYNNPGVFLQALDAGDDIAVHTWSHPHMTTQTNLEVLGQLGWTMQLIHNSTGGRVPRYWRPPYGDSDLRVRAIAKEVFGMDTVLWNNDPRDWAATDSKSIVDQMTQFAALPKSPGLNILEHEVNNITVSAFIEIYPLIISSGWNFASLANAISGGKGGFQNEPSQRKEVIVNQPPASAISAASVRMMQQTTSSVATIPTTVLALTATSLTPTPTPTSAGSRTSTPLKSLSILAVGLLVFL